MNAPMVRKSAELVPEPSRIGLPVVTVYQTAPDGTPLAPLEMRRIDAVEAVRNDPQRYSLQPPEAGPAPARPKGKRDDGR